MKKLLIMKLFLCISVFLFVSGSIYAHAKSLKMSEHESLFQALISASETDQEKESVAKAYYRNAMGISAKGVVIQSGLLSERVEPEKCVVVK